ncbi:MAG: hypothetical protein ABI782_12160 [Anaerolineaceae bacterium]
MDFAEGMNCAGESGSLEIQPFEEASERPVRIGLWFGFFGERAKAINERILIAVF